MGKSILIVDDEPDLAEIIADIAEGEDLTPIIATSAKEALKTLEEQSVDGIFMDIVMPDMDGIELIQAISQKNKTIPIVIMSGYEGKYIEFAESIGQLSGLSIVGTLLKPFNVDQVTMQTEIFKQWIK